MILMAYVWLQPLMHYFDVFHLMKSAMKFSTCGTMFGNQGVLGVGAFWILGFQLVMCGLCWLN